MSGRRPPGEDVDDDKLVEAALKDDNLAASLLMCLFNIEKYYPRWPPRDSSAEMTVAEIHRGLYNWGCRRCRSRCAIREATPPAKIDRASPTTPLSWSGAEGTSGSVCDEGWGNQKRPRKSQTEGGWNGAEMAEPSPSKRPKSVGRSPGSTWTKNGLANEEGAERDFLFMEPSDIGSSAVVPPNKEIAAAAYAAPESSIPADRVEPQRPRLAADAGSSAATRRTGKKKTLQELKILEESLLRDRAELMETIEKQKMILVDLREENQRMSKLKRDVAEEGSSRRHLFDLNCSPEEENR